MLIVGEGGSSGRIENTLRRGYATVAVAYHRAAGVYIDEKKMQQLGTAAVHLLTMATSHMMARSKD